jgi:hypothetical protein
MKFNTKLKDHNIRMIYKNKKKFPFKISHFNQITLKKVQAKTIILFQIYIRWLNKKFHKKIHIIVDNHQRITHSEVRKLYK